MTIYDGRNDQSTQLAMLSGNLGSFSISSSGNSLFVKFQSDCCTNHAGFLATIHYGNPYLNNTNDTQNILFWKWKFNCNTLYLVNCATVSNGEIGFCNCNTCSENEGDCNSHDECQDGLACGSNNCPISLGFDSGVDCCYNVTLGDEDFCTSVTPCGEDEGDCDSDDECQDGLFCGLNNCNSTLGFDSETDCCYTPIAGNEVICVLIRSLFDYATFCQYYSILNLLYSKTDKSSWF